MSDVAALKQLLSLAGDPKKLEAELSRIETAKSQLNEKLRAVREECEALKTAADLRDRESKTQAEAVAKQADLVYREGERLKQERQEFEVTKRAITEKLASREAALVLQANQLKDEKAAHAAQSEAERNAAAVKEKELKRRAEEATKREEVLSAREAELAAAVNAYEDRARRLREALS